MKSGAHVLLSINGGYVDTAGFLALQGLFTAHVTGNFVMVCAALVFGTSGVVAKLLAFPVFCVMVALTRILGHALVKRPVIRRSALLGVQFVLLLAACVLAIWVGPFSNGDSAPAIVVGMVLVSGMAIQNAMHQVHFVGFSPTTVMTGNTTQLMLDVTDLLWLPSDPAERAAERQRLQRIAAGVGCFAFGSGIAALLFWLAGMWCFGLPPVLVLAALAVSARDGSVVGPSD